MKCYQKALLPLFSLLAVIAAMRPAVSADPQPNIVIIMVDDAGLMDFGGFGGEARTPNIDAIGDAGVRFSNYHTSPLCAPSRAMLLTGVDNHRTGIATIPEILTTEQSNNAGYSMSFTDNIETVADKLRNVGYQTYMTGKWHLGEDPGGYPVDHGFDRSFALLASGADNWEQKSYMPYYDDAHWVEDEKKATLPEGFYSSEFIVDKMLDYINQGTDDAPFFAYLAFQAIHIPLQAPKEFTDRYEGVYSDGWDALAEKRFKRAKNLGLIPADAEQPDLHPSQRQWASLTDDEKRFAERSMMVNAGMLEAMDHHIGRLIDRLKETGAFDNTLFVITSDNGPEFNNPALDSTYRLIARSNGYHFDVDRMGEKRSLAAIGSEWAEASHPGRLFKFYASEGGTRVPLIISGPGIAPQKMNASLAFVTDITPTILDYTEVDAAIATQGEPMYGRSMKAVLLGTDTTTHDAAVPRGMEVSGNAALFKGDYKITRNILPHGDGHWRLYNLANDPSEFRDLSNTLPGVKQELIADFDAYADAMGVVAMPADFNPLEQLADNVAARQWQYYGGWIILIGLIVITGIGFAGRYILRAVR